MTEIVGKTEQETEKVKVDLTPRQLKILESELTKPSKATGKQTVEAVAKKLGIGRTTYYKDLKKAGNVQDWRERQVTRLKNLEHIAIAGLLANIEKGNYDAIRDWYLKFAHLFTDQIDIVGKIQALSYDELVDKAKTAIMTAIEQKRLKESANTSGEPKKLTNRAVTRDKGQDKSRDESDFDGLGLA